MRRLLDHDPVTGISEVFHGHGDGGFSIEYVQDVEPVLEANKTAAVQDFNKKSEMWHVASIPITVQYKWLIEKGVDVHNRDHWPKVRQLLNDSEWSYLKRAPIVI